MAPRPTLLWRPRGVSSAGRQGEHSASLTNGGRAPELPWTAESRIGDRDVPDKPRHLQGARTLRRVPEAHDVAGTNARHAELLRACEAVVERLAKEPYNFSDPARTLFYDIRSYFPMNAQERVHRVVSLYMEIARRFVAEHPCSATRRSPARRRAAAPRRARARRAGARRFRRTATAPPISTSPKPRITNSS